MRGRLGQTYADAPAGFSWQGTMPMLGPNGELVGAPTGAEADPSKGTDVRLPDGTWQHFDPQYDSAGNPVSPKTFMFDDGHVIVAMPGTEAYAHAERQMSTATNQAIIKIAALVGGAAAAGAFFGGASTTGELTATHVATASDVAYGSVAAESAAVGAEALTPIVVTATPIVASAEVAAAAASMGLPSIATLATGTTMLSIPALAGSEAAVNALTDTLVSSINTPEMQAAITAGAIPAPPTSLLSSSFTKWGVSTGISQLEKQLGRALTPQEQATAEQQMAAEIQRLQAQLAAQGAPNAQLPNGALDQATVAGMLDSISTNKNVQLALLAGAAILMLASFN